MGETTHRINIVCGDSKDRLDGIDGIGSVRNVDGCRFRRGDFALDLWGNLAEGWRVMDSRPDSPVGPRGVLGEDGMAPEALQEVGQQGDKL